MATCQIPGIRIAGIATAVPSTIRKIDEESETLRLDPQRLARLKKELGVCKRHVVNEEECTSDLCEYAAKFLLSKLDYDASSIDGLLLVTQTPDYFQPATSCVLHGKLGLSKDCAVFDVNLGCSGYVYGLWMAAMMISSGGCHRVLLLAGDTLSRCVSPVDRSVAPLFGDAGSATLIEKTENENPLTFVLHSDGEGFQHLIVPAGAFRKRPSSKTSRMKKDGAGNLRSEEHLHMNGAEIFTFSLREIPLLIKEVLDATCWSLQEVDYFILHQANRFINNNIVRKLEVPLKKSPGKAFEKYGNQSSASIPAVLCNDLSSTLKKSSLKVILAGFGAGLSWAGCATELGPIDCFFVNMTKK